MSCFIGFVKTGTSRVVERFGRYHRIQEPGLRFRYPFVERSHVVNTQICQTRLKFDVRTSDNTFSEIEVDVQYRVVDVHDAFYTLRNPELQIESYVGNTIRAKVPSMTLQQLFNDTTALRTEVRGELSSKLSGYGYSIIDTLITDIKPERKIRDALNRVFETARMREAAVNEAEAERTRLVETARADSERKRLQGEGIAQMRKAILTGWNESVGNTMDRLGITGREAADLALTIQYYDTLKDMASNSGTKVIFAPDSPQPNNKYAARIVNALETVNHGGLPAAVTSGIIVNS